MLSPEASEVLGTCILVAAGLGILLWTARAMRRSPLTPLQTIFWGLNYLTARVLWRASAQGQLQLAPRQGAVIVCNHRSSIDPCFIQMLTPRVVHWLVAKEYCERPALAWFLRLAEVIPVSRGGIDTAATKAAIRCAAQGGLLGIFPEGRINTTAAKLLPVRPGAVLIALRARVPVVPCFISGSPYDGTTLGPLLMPARVRLRVGAPLDLSPYYGREEEREVIEELTRQVARHIARLGDDPDFEPCLAGRSYKPAE